MRIKGSDGHDYNVTGQGQGALNTVLGAVGTYGALSNGSLGGILGGLFGNGNMANMPVSRYEAAMQQEIAAKDGKIALLESNIYTDSKIADVYERLTNKIDANRAAQDAVNTQQAVFNGTSTATISCMQQQIAQLASLSQLVVPAKNVCDTNCCG